MTRKKKLMLGAGLLAGAVAIFEAIRKAHYLNMPIEPNQLSIRGENDDEEEIEDSEEGTSDPC